MCLLHLFFRKYCVNFALFLHLFSPLCAYFFWNSCRICCGIQTCFCISYFLYVCVCLFVVCVCLCVCVCCQLCLVAALIVFVRFPPVAPLQWPTAFTVSSLLFWRLQLVFVVVIIEHRPCRLLSLSLSPILSNSHFEVAKQTKSTVANLRARPEGECGIER